MTAQIISLNVPKHRTTATAATSVPILLGRRYQLLAEELPDEMHGLCGGFVCTSTAGGALPLPGNANDRHCYLWDADGEPELSGLALVSSRGEPITTEAGTRVATNRFVLSNATLCNPEIVAHDNAYWLSTRADFDCVYTADEVDARLGVLTLLECDCSIILENGERHTLLDSGDARKILFVNTEHPDDVIHPVLDAAKGDQPIQGRHEESPAHRIPEHLDGTEVETMTILEQYQTLFMQRETTVPTCSTNDCQSRPVSWITSAM